jgi:hypothetical protein
MEKENFKQKLFNEILIQNSESYHIYPAVQEWVFNKCFNAKTKCICSTDITTCYEIKNKFIENKFLIVGSSCIKKFMKQNENLINIVKIKDYNKRVKEKNKFYKKCNICGDKFKLNNLSEHDWKKWCYSCYKRLKKINLKKK